MGIFSTAVLIIIVLGLLVLIHEIGHFVASKRLGVRVEEFGIGFPPKIWGKKIKSTLYSINWIPLGGFVRIKGVVGDSKEDDPTAKTQADSFRTQTFSKKFVILFAGIGMNILLAAILFAVTYMVGVQTERTQIRGGAIVQQEQLVITAITPNSAAAAADLRAGDVVIKFDGVAVEQAENFQTYIKNHKDTEVALEILRDQQIRQITLVPRELTIDNNMYIGIGVGLLEIVQVRYPFLQSLWLGISTTFTLIGQIFVALFQIVQKIFMAEDVSADFTGPIGIAVMTKQVAQLGFVHLLQFVAILSVNLAIFNLLPIPALDGGRILFVIIEKLRRKSINEKIEGLVHTIGFSLLLILILLVTFKDINQFKVVDFIKNVLWD